MRDVRAFQIIPLPENFVFQLVDYIQVGDIAVVPLGVKGVYPGAPRRQWIDERNQLSTRTGWLGPLDQVVRDIVLCPADVVVEQQFSPARVILVENRHGVVGVVLAVVRNQLFAHVTDRESQTGCQVDSSVEIESTPAALVREVRFIVVFETVYRAVVVHVHTEQEFWTIRAKAQERFLVVGEQVRPVLTVVLVEIRDKIVVLVKPGENRDIDRLVGALPVGVAVLIVVVVDEIIAVQVGPGVVYDSSPWQVNAGSIGGLHAVGLSEEKPRIRLFPQVHHPGIGGFHNPVVLARLQGAAIGIAAVAAVAIEFGIQVDPPHIGGLDGEAENFIGCGQPVIQHDEPLI